MKKLFILFIFALAWIINVNAQNCLPEGITFTTQEQIDNFRANHPGCTEIEGTVTITGADITDLDSLSVLIFIGGDLIIKSNEMLEELSGLSNLENLGGNLHIEQNNVLVNLHGFENLSTLNGDLIIGDIILGQFPYSTGNPSLTSLTGLNNLDSIQGNFKLCGNYSLSTLSGIENLAFIGGNLQVGGIDFIYGFKFGNPLLVNLSGLSQLDAIGGSLFVAGNIKLVNLSGLETLTTIGQHCWFDLNESLVSLQGLNQLTSMGGSLRIRWNISLSNISGLENITGQTIQDLEIIYNQNLFDCSIISICDYLADPNGTIEIYDNAPGCNSVEEVEEACLTDNQEFISESGMKILRNPSSDKITILLPAFTDKTELSILNLNGEKLLEKQVNTKETTLNISALPQGVYFVRVQDIKMVEVGKFIKK